MEQLLFGIRTPRIDRRSAMQRGLALGLGASAVSGLLASGGMGARPPVVAQPAAEPVSLTIIDVAGQAQLTQAAIEDHVENNPDRVPNLEVTQATALELAFRSIAQQEADRTDISMVLTGSAGIRRRSRSTRWRSSTWSLRRRCWCWRCGSSTR